MQTISVQDAQAQLPAIIQAGQAGEEIVILDDEKRVARLIIEREAPALPPRQLGLMRGSVLYMSPDFDAIPEGWEEHV